MQLMPSTDRQIYKRTIGKLSSDNSKRRFLFATDSFSLSSTSAQSLHLDAAVFSQAADLDTKPMLAFGSCVPLSVQDVAEREDLHISVKLFISPQRSGSTSQFLREALKTSKSLLNTANVDSLIIQLPDNINSSSELVTSRAVLVTEPKRKSRRLQHNLRSSPELNPVLEDGSGTGGGVDITEKESFLWESVLAIARSEFGIQRVGVSSSNLDSLNQFLQTVDLQKSPIDGIMFDSYWQIQTLGLEAELDALESVCHSRGLTLLVSNDERNVPLEEASVGKFVERINSSMTEPVLGVSRDWTVKYTVFGETRSVLLQHGYLIMGSSV